MGFAIYYRSTEPVASDQAEAIESAASAASEGRTWLSCEPANFVNEDDGRLFGASKPCFDPDPRDAAALAAEGSPDGTVKDLLDALCEISRAHHVDWEISHDYCSGPIGFIRDGVADEDLMDQIDAVGEAIAHIAGDLESDAGGFSVTDDPPPGADDEIDDDDDEPPPTLKLWTG